MQVVVRKSNGNPARIRVGNNNRCLKVHAAVVSSGHLAECEIQTGSCPAIVGMYQIRFSRWQTGKVSARSGTTACTVDQDAGGSTALARIDGNNRRGDKGGNQGAIRADSPRPYRKAFSVEA